MSGQIRASSDRRDVAPQSPGVCRRARQSARVTFGFLLNARGLSFRGAVSRAESSGRGIRLLVVGASGRLEVGKGKKKGGGEEKSQTDGQYRVKFTAGYYPFCAFVTQRGPGVKPRRPAMSEADWVCKLVGGKQISCESTHHRQTVLGRRGPICRLWSGMSTSTNVDRENTSIVQYCWTMHAPARIPEPPLSS